MFGLFGPNEVELLKATAAGDEAKVQDILRKRVELARAPASKATCRRCPEVEEGVTPAHLAAQHDHRRLLELFISLKADLNAQAVDGATPLHLAAAEGHVETVQLLLDHQVRVDTRNEAGQSPLHLAAAGNHLPVVKALLAHGAMVNAQDVDGNTPLHYAARDGAERLVQSLLKHGANAHLRNGTARTPLHMAIIGGEHGMTGQIHAVQQRREKTRALVMLLLRHGAEVNALDNANETPLDLLSYLAGDTPDQELVQILIGAGGKWVRSRRRQAESGIHTMPPAPNVPVAPVQRLGDSAHGSALDHDTDIIEQTQASQASQAASDSHGSGMGGAGQAPIPLGNSPIIIGRNPECHVRYRSRTLSRRHAKIERQGRDYVISDMGSHNGTVVDGKLITGTHVLKPGEMIELGNYEFEFDGDNLIPVHGEFTEEELTKERIK